MEHQINFPVNFLLNVLSTIWPFFIVAIIIFILVKIQKSKVEKNKKIAQQLGFSFSENPMREQMPHIGFWGRFRLSFQNQKLWEMKGDYKGLKTSIFAQYMTKGESTYLFIEVFFAKSLNLGLCITTENVLTKFLKLWNHSKDVQIGDTEFDKKFLVNSNNPTAVTSLLNKPDVKQAIYNLFNIKHEVIIEDDKISLRSTIYITDIEEYKNYLDKLVDAAKKLQPEEASNW